MRQRFALHRGRGRVPTPWGMLAVAALLCLFFHPLPVGAADFKTAAPAVIVRVHSLNGLLGDLKHLADLSGQGDVLKPLEDFLQGRGGKGIDGLDRSKPFGFYAGTDVLVALAPVADEKAFLDWLAHLGVKTEMGKGDLYRGALPGAHFALSFRFSDGYVCATLGAEAALNKDVLLPPGQVFPAGQARLVSAVVRLDQIKDDSKRLARALVNQKRAALQEQPLLGDTASRRDLQKRLLEDAGNLLESVLRDGRQLQMSFDLDRRSGELVAELSLDGKPMSGLAGLLESLGRSRSVLVGVAAEGAALHGLVNLALPEKSRQALAAVIDEGVNKDGAWPADLLKVLAPALKSGELGGVVNLQPPAPQGEGKPYTLLLGLKFKEGPAADRALRELLKDQPQGDRLPLDAEKPDEVAIHRVNLQKELGAGGRKVFGAGRANVAVRGDALLLALGGNGLPALKEALAAPPQAGPLVHFEVHLARLAPAIALDRGDTKGTVAKAAAEAFPGGGKDRLLFTVEGGPALKVRVAVNAAVLKFVGLLENAEAEGK
jgi:hypothetical protein